MNGPNFAAMIVGCTTFVAAAVIVWIISNNARRKRIAEMQTNMQTKLLEKFGSSQELIEYLQSEPGQRFLESASIERARPAGRILGSIQAGLILALAGAVLAAVNRGRVDDAGHGVFVLGLLCGAVGLGFLLSAFVSYRLSKSWGLMNVRPKAGVKELRWDRRALARHKSLSTAE